MSEEDGPEFTKPTHRCPKCGGTSLLSKGPWSDDQKPCPTCSPFGPFGLVPAIVAIEASLSERLGRKEKAIRAKGKVSTSAASWLLRDAAIRCPACDGSGQWQPSTRSRVGQRVCFECNGRGVLR